MKRQFCGIVGAACAGVLLAAGQTLGAPILSSSDAAIAIDAHGKTSRSSSPGSNAENVPNAIDGVTTTKYLNFGHSGSGFIVTPSAATPVESFRITTANDAPGRDPATWELWGFNGALVSPNHSAGLDEAWTLIQSGSVALPGDPAVNGDQRGVAGPLVDVASGGVGYQHYKMVFPRLKDLSRANSMQIAEIQFYSDNAGTTGILAPGNPTRAINFGFESRYGINERPAQVLDQVATTKYLNFGEERSGLIITNAEGPETVFSMRLTTANDAVDRDPASYELWGTNNVVTSQDNGDGLNAENWTLISSGALALPAARLDSSTLVPINATVAYKSYKLIFPTVKNAAGANSMQIADVQFNTIPEPGSLALVLASLAAGCGQRRKR
jgi:hypothetical protein